MCGLRLPGFSIIMEPNLEIYIDILLSDIYGVALVTFSWNEKMREKPAAHLYVLIPTETTYTFSFKKERTPRKTKRNQELSMKKKNPPELCSTALRTEIRYRTCV